MQKIQRSEYFYPFIIFCICVWRIFVPQLPYNDGLGWDGFKYYSLVRDGLGSGELDSYIVFRIFPSLLVRTVLRLSGIICDPGHVILAFKIMNTVLITLSALMVKRIFSQFKLNGAAQLIGFFIVFMNYGILNFTFYYPVMTDTPACFLSIALFYFFVRGELLNVLLVGLIGAFTWPVLLPMALGMVLFPDKIPYVPVSKRLLYTLCGLSFVFSMVIGIYLVFLKHEQPEMRYTLSISYGMLPVTFIGFGIMFFFMPMVFGNKTFFTAGYYKALLNKYGISACLITLLVVIFMRNHLTVKNADIMTSYFFLKAYIYSFQRPLISLVSQLNYFGAGVLLIIIFWKRFAAFISTFGLGVSAAIFISLSYLCVKPETRTQIHIFSWLLILISLYAGQFRFNSAFYAFIIIANIIFAKLWFFFDYDFDHYPILPDNTIGFPEQWFFMHLGSYMNADAWLGLFILTLACIIIFLFILYGVKFEKRDIVLYPKFQAIIAEPEAILLPQAEADGITEAGLNA